MTHPKITRRSLWALCAAALTLTLWGFARADSPEGPTGKVRQGLVGGTEVSEKTQEAYGLLSFDLGGGSCSASLLRNDWAISAAHCVDAKDGKGNAMSDPNRPGQNVMSPMAKFKLTAAWGGGQTKKATRVETFWPYDVSLINIEQKSRMFSWNWEQNLTKRM